MDTNELFEKFIDSYGTQPDEIRKIIDHNKIGSIVAKYLPSDISVIQRNHVINQLHFCLTNLISINEADSSIMKTISNRKVTDSILIDFKTLLDVSPPPPTTPVRPLTPQPEHDLKTEIEETEAALEALKPLRTMAHDMEVLKTVPPPAVSAPDEPPVYTSTQSALLNEVRPATIHPKDPTAGRE